VKNISFELLELEMADLERFWRKTPLGPLGVKLLCIQIKIFMSAKRNAYDSGSGLTVFFIICSM
jgi:hypothetical protein